MRGTGRQPVACEDPEARAASLDDLAGRVAVVTGAAGGIGFELAAAAASRGMRVALADVDEAAVHDAAKRLAASGADVAAFGVDVGSLPSMRQLAQAIENQLGPVWLCCNNAGRSRPGRAWTLTEDDWTTVLRVNLGGVVNGIQVFLPSMVARNEGHLVNVASIAGLVVAPGRANYTASKHAVVGVSEAAYRDLVAVGSAVGVTVVCPGPVATRRWAGRTLPDPDLLLRPENLAQQILTAVVNRQFWLLPHASHFAAAMLARTNEALHGTNPDAASADPAVS